MANINQITTMRLPNGAEVAFVDWSDTPLWSSADFLAGFTDTEIDLFQYVSGEPVPATQNVTARRTSTDFDTNIATPGSMASTEEMLVYAIRPEIFEFSLDSVPPIFDANARTVPLPNQPSPTRKRLGILHASLLLTLEVSQKFTHRASLGYYNAGSGVFGQSLVVPVAAPVITAATPGVPGQDAVRALVVPVHIGGQEKYRVRLENVSGGPVASGLDEANPAVNDPQILHTIIVKLDGLYKRPVS